MKNLSIWLKNKIQIDSDMTAEYSNFDDEACISSPAINSNKVNWRWTHVEATLDGNVSVGKVVRDNNSDGDNNDGKDHENMDVEFVASLCKVLKLFDSHAR